MRPMLALAFLLAGTAPPAGAQCPAPCAPVAPAPAPSGTLTALRAPAPPRIDGRDTDPVWRVAERRGDFRTFSPQEGAEPAFRTEIQAAYDDRALYVLVRAFDPRPDRIVRILSRRDTDGPPNDQVQLFIDSFHDHRSGYEYIVNAAGVKSDYLIFDDTGFDQSWDGAWDAATQVDSLGWTAEFVIPLSQLRFSGGAAPQFGIMLWRLVGRSGERASWPAYRPSRSGYMSQTGTLTGMRELVRPASLEATPYALARSRNPTPGAPLRTSITAGGDLRFLPKPNLSVDATVNPDFGQVESDPAVLNLSGFEVFQAERRPFFLEGAGQFSLPLANDGSAMLFHSRRIGRAPALGALGGLDAPTETTIYGAAKLTARLSPSTSLVALSAVTAEERSAGHVLEPGARFAVTRVQRDFRGGRSGVGLMVTHVDRRAGDSLSAALIPDRADAAVLTTQHQTADGNYRLSGWIGASLVRGSEAAIGALQRSTVHGFQQPDDGVRFDSTRTGLDGMAFQLYAGKVAGGFTRFDASYRRIASGFDVNELGFLTRSGIQNLAAHAGLRATRAGRLAGLPYRSASLTLGFSGDWSTAGLPFGRGLSLTGTMQLGNQIFLQGAFSRQLPGAFCTMSCTRGGPALVDPPRTATGVDVTGDPRRRLIPHLHADWYRDDGGRSHGGSVQADLLWRARSNLDVTLAATAGEATEDAFFYRPAAVARLVQPVRVITTRLDYTVTTTLSLQWYAEAYLSRGTYSNIREIVAPRARRYDDRFGPFADGTVPDGPTGADFRQLRSNAVLRWEYRPASTLFLVWTQRRGLEASEPGSLRLGSDLRGLFRRPPTDLIAVKVAYWLSR